MARRRPERVGLVCLGACAAACVLAATHIAFHGAALLQYPGKGGGLYGFQRDETAVGRAERGRAMDTLARAEGCATVHPSVALAHSPRRASPQARLPEPEIHRVV